MAQQRKKGLSLGSLGLGSAPWKLAEAASADLIQTSERAGENPKDHQGAFRKVSTMTRSAVESILSCLTTEEDPTAWKKEMASEVETRRHKKRLAPSVPDGGREGDDFESDSCVSSLRSSSVVEDEDASVMVDKSPPMKRMRTNSDLSSSEDLRIFVNTLDARRLANDATDVARMQPPNKAPLATVTRPAEYRPGALTYARYTIWRATVAQASSKARYIAEAKTTNGGEVVVMVGSNMEKRVMYSELGDFLFDPFDVDASVNSPFMDSEILIKTTRLSSPHYNNVNRLKEHLRRVGFGDEPVVEPMRWIAACLAFGVRRVTESLIIAASRDADVKKQSAALTLLTLIPVCHPAATS